MLNWHNYSQSVCSIAVQKNTHLAWYGQTLYRTGHLLLTVLASAAQVTLMLAAVDA